MNIIVKMTSDWQIGSGAGVPGSVDHEVIRDPDGLPFLPAKTLTGILRDAAEAVAYQLDRHRPDKSWQRVVSDLFGRQPHTHGGNPDEPAQGARLGIRKACLPDGLRALLAGEKREELRSALYFIQPGVAIDPQTGQSRNDHLYMMERVRQGGTLIAPVDTPEQKPLTPFENAILHAAALSVSKIGGNRRRGSGRCSLRLEGMAGPPDGAADWIDWLQKHWRDDIPVFRCPDPTSPPVVSPCGKEHELTPFRMTVTSISPLIFQRAILGNVVTSLDYIPGTVLLPILQNRLVKMGERPDELRSLIQSGNIQVTPLHVMVNGQSTSPVPQTWYAPKGEKGLSDPNSDVINRLVRPAMPGIQLKGYRQGWITREDTRRPRFDDGGSLMIQQTHNTISDRVQHPTEAVGGVFTYQALKSGLVFSGCLWMPKDMAARLEAAHPDWMKQVSGRIVAGKSKKDDYGAAWLDISAIPEEELRPIQLHHHDGGFFLVVWLLSNVLIRDVFMGYSAHPECLRKYLEKELQVKLDFACAKALGGDVTVIGRIARLDSWHTGWKLPRPSLTGLSAGSVFTFAVTQREKKPWDGTQAARLVQRGIGDRCAEGFGRIAFNPPLLFQPRLTDPSGLHKPPTPPEHPPLEPEQKEFFRQVETEFWKERIRREAVTHAFSTGNYFGISAKKWWKQNVPLPPTSQWGGLRSASMSCRDDLRPLQNWLNSLERVKNRNEKWPDRSLAVIRKMAENDEIWEILSNPETCCPDAWVGKSGLRETLKTFAVRTLIDTVCQAVFDRAAGPQEG